MKKLGMAALAALMVAGTMAASVQSADARWRGGRGHHHHHRGHGGIGLGIASGLALGVIGAGVYGAHAGYGRCWTERQIVVDRYGREFVRPVRVCD
jgi:hypothetical protein